MNPSPNRPATDATKLDWKSFPWALMLLGALLLASQFLNPGKGQQTALSWYESSGLQQLEWNNYLSWLRFNGNAEQAKILEKQLSNGNPHGYAAAMFATQFVEDSDKRARDFWSSEQIEQWRSLRAQVPQQLENSPLYRWGLSAADPRPSRFFTAPFTGGSLWLTLLGLVGLAVVALRLERQLGAGRIVVIWLAGSLLSGAGYLMTVGLGETPLHGAAPAVMALLAAAAALSREPIHLTLPKGKTEQLSLSLPAWIVSIVPLLLLAAIAFTKTPMFANLSAGLLAAFGGALLAVVIQPHESAEEVPEQDAATINVELQQALTHGWSALGKLDGGTAERHFREVLKSEPEQFDALTGLFTAQQMQQPTPEDWHQTANILFSLQVDDAAQATQIAHHWRQYRQHAAKLPEPALWQLVITLTAAEELKLAEQLAMQHAEYSDEQERRKGALGVLRDALLKEGLSQRANALPQ
ncbi:rhomboid family intramembrane serine protease [Alcanivorax sediminis]|uniref:Rhomboid family intramembrane serine protease n=1 Tax=Alcanivorax sediminis TaxID=2663008 RepID=A0A6N7LRU2_9GAMM|nr:rhomboid family intramembrane serine protease [Alcanivorax sediminis]MQX53149.1 rhomboid family intramembrane serine protease [Alcanivorax sediminis]